MVGGSERRTFFIWIIMKKKSNNALGIACITAILAACILTDDAGDPFWGNYALLAIAALTGYGAKRKEDKING